MAKNSDTRAQVKEITDRLAEGVREIFTTEQYAKYLKTMSRFHSYSTRNTMLIYLQKPDATLVAGFRTWQTKFKRNVKRGEKGIRILAPTPFTVKKELNKLDPDTQRLVLDADGVPVTEEVEIRIPRFKPATVFDASQTEGKPLPKLAMDIFGSVKNYSLLIGAIRAASPLPIFVVPLEDTKDGVCVHGKEIRLREGMSEVQTVCAAVHEVAHAKLHDTAVEQAEGGAKPKSKTAKEIEAESVAYAVCQYFGIETAPNSFGYLASWSSSMEVKELTAALDTIRGAAASLIDDIEMQYRALAKGRGIDLEETKGQAREDGPALPQTADTEMAPNEVTPLTNGTDLAVIAADSMEILPDCTVTPATREEYGAAGMLPLQKDRALELFDGEQVVYLLHPDGTEEMALERGEIEAHTGIFGIEAAEWQQTEEYAQLKSAAAAREAERDGDDFVELPAFLGEEQPTNSQNGNRPGAYNGPTVAELEDAAGRGETISLYGLSKALQQEKPGQNEKKPSIIAQLQAHQQTAAGGVESVQTAPNHNSQREV